MAVNIVLGSVTLPLDLRWTNQYKWHPVATAQERTLSGGLIVDLQNKVGGRPITLASGVDNQGRIYAAVTLDVVNQLQALLSPADQTFTLVLADDSVRQVMWRADEAVPFEATEIKHIAPHVGDDWYTIILRLQEVVA